MKGKIIALRKLTYFQYQYAEELARLYSFFHYVLGFDMIEFLDGSANKLTRKID